MAQLNNSIPTNQGFAAQAAFLRFHRLRSNPTAAGRFNLLRTWLFVLLFMLLPMASFAAAAPAALTSPAPGSQLAGSSATFSWTAGSSVTAYQLTLGTSGAGASNLYNSGSIGSTSVNVTGLPTGGTTWGTMDAIMECSGQAQGSALSTAALTSCTAGNTAGGFELSESPLTPMQVAPSQGSLGASVTVGGTVYPAAIATQSLSYNHQYGSQDFSFVMPYGVNALTLNMNGYLTFAPAATGSTDTTYDYLVAQDSNGGHAFAIQLHTGTYNGCTYCVFLETNPNWTVTRSTSGIPVTAGTRYAFSVQGNESAGTASLALYNATTFAQIASTITDAAPTGSHISRVFAGNTVSSTSTGHTSYFEDLMLDWSGHQSFPNAPHAATVYATLSSQIAGAWQTASYTYSEAPTVSAAVPTLGVNATSVSFSNVTVGVTNVQSITLSSTGTGPVTVSSATLAGAGFMQSGTTFPLTLNAGQKLTLYLQFDPLSTGAVTGQLTLVSNSSTNGTVVVSLIGTGVPALNALSCANASVTGSGTNACTVTLNAAAATGGFTVSLASSNASVTIPASVTVAAGATSASASAAIASVSSTQAVTLTATAGSVAKTFALQLNAAVPTLSINTTSIAFGSVAVNTPTTQQVTLSSTGSAAVTVSAATETGAGFTISGASFPLTLNPGQSATLSVQFDPASAGAAAGQLAILSNSSTSASAVISLSGTGAATPAALVNPAAGSTLPGSSATFSWTPGTGVTAYQLTLGTTGANSSNIYSSGSTTATSANVSGLPTGNASWGTMDAIFECGQAQGTVLGSSVLPSCMISNAGGGFDLTEDPLAPMMVAASRGTLGASVTVAETTYAATAATQSMSFNHQYSQEYFSYDVPYGVNTYVLNMNGYITFGPAATGSSDAAYDYIVAQDINGGHAFVVQLHTGTFQGCTYCVFLETNPNWAVTNSAAGIPITPGARYALSVQGNETAGTASLALYTASTFAQIGTTITDVAPTGSTITHVMVGNTQSSMAPGYTSYFEDLMMDWSGHQFFPNVPQPATVYATLSSEIGGVWQSANYIYAAAPPAAPAPAVLSKVSCSSASMAGLGSDACTVTLSGAAVSGGQAVSLASSSASVSVPASVTVAAGATTASFTASVAAVSTTQTAMLTATAGSASASFGLQLNVAAPALSVNATSVAFGNVAVNTAATQSLTLTSTGSAAVTVSSATLTGAGFTLSGATFPLTLNPGQSATLNVQFDPTNTGAANGQLAIASNSSTGSSAAVSLTGTGQTLEVMVSWNAPVGSTDPTVGYIVMRSLASSSSYQQLTTAAVTATSYVDTTAQAGQSYNYIVESVDASGIDSAPSSMASVTMP